MNVEPIVTDALISISLKEPQDGDNSNKQAPADLTEAEFRRAVCNFMNYMRPIKDTVNNIEHRLDTIEILTAANTRDIEEMRDIAVNNTESISELLIKFDKLEEHVDFDTFQAELSERERRSEKLLIRNVPVFPNEQFKDDLEFIHNIIDKINLSSRK